MDHPNPDDGLSIAESSSHSSESFFESFSRNDANYDGGFDDTITTQQERDILQAMMTHTSSLKPRNKSMTSSNGKKSTGSSSSSSRTKGHPTRTSNTTALMMNGNPSYSDSMATAATVLLDDADESNSSQSTTSFTGSVEPVKKRLSRKEENAFAMGETSGSFEADDSFASWEEAFSADNTAALNNFSSRVSPVANGNSSTSSSTKRGGHPRRYSAGSLHSSSTSTSRRRSLSSVEDHQVASQLKPKALSRKLSGVTAPTVQSEETDEVSIDPSSLFEKKKSKKKLSPVKEGKLKKKKSTRSIVSSAEDSRKSSMSSKSKSASSKADSILLAESADEILARWNRKIDQIEREAAEQEERLAKAATSNDWIPAAYTSGGPQRKLAKQASMSNISAAASAMSSLSCDVSDYTTALRDKQSSRKPRRPSLHTVFEWNKEPSTRSLDPSVEDLPAGEDNLVVNMSSVLRTPRRRCLKKSLSTSDIFQYNNTPQWPPSNKNRRPMTGNLHAQFYLRETKHLNTPYSVNRSVESSPVLTPQQMLSVMEPVTLREVLAFKGLQRDDTVESRKRIDYGSILDSVDS